jgi:uncharacterized protein (DUF1015 family)
MERGPIMADIRAFRGFRYELARVGKLEDVIAPPYDVIDGELQDALYQRSPYNVVRLILNKETPSDSEQNNRYTRAARHLRDWQNDGILTQDSARSLYVYHQDFEIEGKQYTRKGFMARVRLEPFGEGRIFPHEETLAGPKADRLKLFHATGMNLSQIFGLYPDENSAVQEILERTVGRALALEATDHLGVRSRIWPITDQHTVSQVTGLMGPRPIFIADGHHRYETALRYREERKAAGDVADAEAPANFVLMMLVGMSDPGLVILPTHRLVSGVPELTADQMRAVLQPHFEVTVVGSGPAAAAAAWEAIEMDGSQNLLAFGTIKDGIWQTARFQAPALMAELAREHSSAWQGLGVSILHVAVLQNLLPARFPVQPQCRYVHLLREVTDAMAARQCQVAVLVPPAGMEHVEQIAGNLEKMPPKSTYFYPKLLSGLVFNSLRV